jgi:hypothetical protein
VSAPTGPGYRLGVDFGTSNTVAMLGRPDGHIRPLLFDGSPSLPSSVCIDPSGLLVGRDAVHAARVAPERFEPNPKRRIDETSVLLGEAEIRVDDLIAAVLNRVAVEARRVAGGPVTEVTLTYPAAWAHTRRGILLSAAAKAGLGNVVLVPEPIAAASSFVGVAGGTVPPGGVLVVYDLGAGTFDASVVRRGPAGFEVLAAEGLSQGGGLDIDAAIVAYLGAVYQARDPAMWARLSRPTTTTDRRANHLLWEDVRSAKEMLSRATATTIHVPIADESASLDRSQFEQLARPVLNATVAATRAALAAAHVSPAEVAGIFLVGGASRIPLVTVLLRDVFGREPAAVEQPELVVAEGSLRALDMIAPAARPAAGRAAAVPPASVSAPPAPVTPAPAAAASGPITSGHSGPITAGPSGPISPAAEQPTSAPPYGSPFAPYASDPMTYATESAQHVSAPPATPVSGSFGPASAPPWNAGPVSAPPVQSSSPPAYSAAPAQSPPTQPQMAQSPPAASGSRRSTGLVLAGTIVAVVIALVVGGIVWLGGRDDGDSGDSGTDTSETTDGSGDDGGDDGGSGDENAATASDVTWSSNAADYNGSPGVMVQYECPGNGSPGSVWGSDIYTTDSSVCTAAVHVGQITLEEGGTVVIVIKEGMSEYYGSERNGITSGDWGSYEDSFAFK